MIQIFFIRNIEDEIALYDAILAGEKAVPYLIGGYTLHFEPKFKQAKTSHELLQAIKSITAQNTPLQIRRATPEDQKVFDFFVRLARQ